MNGFKEAGIVDALENGVVAPPQHDEILSDEDETEDQSPHEGNTHVL